MKRTYRFRRLSLGCLVFLLAACLLAMAGSWLSNRRLPARSAAGDRLSDLEKAQLAEAVHLRQELGDRVWPGWGEADIPIIVYNEKYVFLVGLPGPQPGWYKMPARQPRGGAWEPVPDTFAGQPYYRQPLPGAGLTPENFTVQVGERWVVTLESRPYMEVNFYNGLRQDLPAFTRQFFPYRLAWQFMFGETENYLSGLEHESFHAFQGSRAFDRLASAEHLGPLEGEYPWEAEAQQAAWKEEAASLAQAVHAGSVEECRSLAAQFLARRQARREAAGLAPALVEFERQREWLEGLAKYAELELLRQAGAGSGYSSLEAIQADPRFKNYANSVRFYNRQLDQVKFSAGQKGEGVFYYSGMLQAVLLDRLSPGWKGTAFDTSISLEELLSQALPDL